MREFIPSVFDADAANAADGSLNHWGGMSDIPSTAEAELSHICQSAIHVATGQGVRVHSQRV